MSTGPPVDIGMKASIKRVVEQMEFSIDFSLNFVLALHTLYTYKVHIL
jgi:hypothetical protein